MISSSQYAPTQTQFGHTVSMPSLIRHSHPHHGHTHPALNRHKSNKALKKELSNAFSKVPFNQYVHHYGSLTKSFLKNLYQSAKLKSPKHSHGEGNFLNSVKVWIEDFMSIVVEDVKRLWKFLTGDTSAHKHSHSHSHDYNHHHHDHHDHGHHH